MNQVTKMNMLNRRQLAGVATLFKALGEPMRLRILQEVCQEPKCVSEIVATAGCTQANVSKHLALLMARGIINRQQKGRHAYYVIRDPLTLQLCQLVHANLASSREAGPRSARNKRPSRLR
jgi:DNA-binding transcriptional ArsR family regulator